MDHDRKNLLGSPDLFAEIHAKITQSTVFVGDITPVATTPSGKKVMNPNVAIELGIALESIGTNSIIFMMNKAYGDHASMPFNLAHKSGPVMYELPEDASAAQIKAEQKKLVSVLKEYIGPYIEAAKPKPALFELAPTWQDTSSFVDGGAMTVVDTRMGRAPKSVKLRTGGRMFIRIFPKLAVPALTVEQLENLSTDGTLQVLYFDASMDWGRTADGFVVYAILRDNQPCPDYVKIFQTGEIWAVLHYELLDSFAMPLQFMINRLATRLDNYSNFLQTKLGYKGDIGFVAGITGIQNRQVAGLKYGSIAAKMGLGMLPQVVVRSEKTPKQTAPDALLPFATQAWEAFGLPRKAIEPH